MPTLRERVQRNVAIWLLGSLVVGFAAGIGAYKASQEIAGLSVVAASEVTEWEKAAQRIDELERELATAERKSEESSTRLTVEGEIRKNLEAELERSRTALQQQMNRSGSANSATVFYVAQQLQIAYTDTLQAEWSGRKNTWNQQDKLKSAAGNLRIVADEGARIFNAEVISKIRDVGDDILSGKLVDLTQLRVDIGEWSKSMRNDL